MATITIMRAPRPPLKDAEVPELLREILTELKKNNAHLARITDVPSEDLAEGD